jgi:hypothetical protein
MSVCSSTESGSNALERAVPLTPQERWRIPIIFSKIGKGAALSAIDKKVWAAFISDKTEAEVLTHLATALSERLPDQQLVLQKIIEDATLPENCPFPGHSESPGKLVSSRSLSDFSRMSDCSESDDSGLFAAPKLVRVGSYDTASSRTLTERSPSDPTGLRTRARLPRSGTGSKLASPVIKSATGIADTSPVVASHKRSQSLNVLDALATALQRGLRLGHASEVPSFLDGRTDTVSSDDGAEFCPGISMDGLASSSSSSSSKRRSTPPASFRPAADPFPPPGASSTSTTPSRRSSFKVPFSPASASVQTQATFAALSMVAAAEPGRDSKNPSRSSSPSFLRSLAIWGSGSGSGKVVPGGEDLWDYEN